MEKKKNWREYTATVEDIQLFLEKRVCLQHNVVTRRVEYRVIEPDEFEQDQGRLLDADAEFHELTDRAVNSLWSEMSATKTVRIQDMYRVLESEFVPDYNPFRLYLERLPPWDGQNHILCMSTSVQVKGGVNEQIRFYEYLRKWLVGMVGGWIDPTVVNNVILVLIGEQGSYKTT